MTDVLPGVSETLDNLTSHAETPPQRPEAAPLLTTCRYCPETFEGGARFFRRGLHEKSKHPDEWTAAKAGVKPKKKAAKKQPTPRARPQTATPKPKRIAAADSAVRAVRNPKCSPLELPADKYDQWKRIDFTFDPRDML